jgi:hypothetical protein
MLLTDFERVMVSFVVKKMDFESPLRNSLRERMGQGY